LIFRAVVNLLEPGPTLFALALGLTGDRRDRPGPGQGVHFHRLASAVTQRIFGVADHKTHSYARTFLPDLPPEPLDFFNSHIEVLETPQHLHQL